MKLGWEKITVLALISSLVGCGGSSDTASCSETGPYACQTGATEPLYTYQWALKSATSFFTSYTGVSDGTTDLNVEAVHAQGIKGQGVNVLVLDDGVDINHEDLKANVNTSMTWNFQNNNTDPTPTAINDAHGTNAAGIIAAAQNGIGVMGIAPRVTLGAAGDMINVNALEYILAFGGSPWSVNAHVINYSISASSSVPAPYDEVGRHPYANLRNGKGITIVQSAGNQYIETSETPPRDCPKVSGTVQIVSCENPTHDRDRLNPMRIVAAAANAMGYRSSYSSAGSSVWVTGLGGEGASGNYGEAGTTSSVPGQMPPGPEIYSTDISGCTLGYARNPPNDKNDTAFSTGGTSINVTKNSDCKYSHMNGTSAAAPTITGVVALMLSANPNLTWRDVRHILATTSRQIDSGYGSAYQRNEQINLAGYTFTGDTSSALTDGASTARLDYGWQTNAAGYKYSNWYGFGLPNAAAAVAAAQATTVYKSAPLTLPSFTLDTALTNRTVDYGKVTKLGQFTVSGTDRVDAIQVRLNSNAAGLCIGSVGVYVKSPSGMVSVLAVPYNIYYKTDKKIVAESYYGLTSYAFYGEAAAGTWEVYAVSGTPQTACTTDTTGVASVEYRIIASP